MGTTTSTNTVLLPVVREAVKTALQSADAFSSSKFAGYSFVQTGISNGEARIGKTVQIPHWNMVGQFEDVNDGVALTPRTLGNDYTEATVARSGLAVQVTRWANQAYAGKTLEESFAEQWVKRFNQHIDKKLMTAAVSATNLPADQQINYYSSSAPVYLDYSGLVDLKSTIGDRQYDRYGLIVHSKVYAHLLKAKDGTGRPLVDWQQINALFDNKLDIIISDRTAISDGVFVVSSSGTTPPTVTLSGTPNRKVNFKMECTTLGARGTAVVRTSINGGVTWKSSITTAATFSLLDPDDDDAATGITVNYANASAAVDNVWTATGTQKAATLLVGPKALAYQYDDSAILPAEDFVVLSDSRIWASNVYWAAARFLNDYGNERRPDVSIIYTNMSV